jgi:DNA-binding HxlR family transcriptional regulator
MHALEPPVPNSLGYGSLVLGDRWNLLILREAFRGVRRFSEWTDALGVSDPVLAARLKDLTRLGLLERRESATSAGRQEYRLTDAAKQIWQVFVAIWLWDRRWAPGPVASSAFPRTRLRHDRCGFTVLPVLGCGNCEARGVTLFETSARRHPGYTYDQSNPPRPYRRVQPAADAAGAVLHAIDLLGDRWSTSVLAAAFLGAHRFQDFARDIGTIPPLMLTDRINRFVEQGVLARRPVAAGKRRMGYHLTTKGADFFAIYACEIAWSAQAFQDAEGPPLVIEHLPCGAPLEPCFVCNACNERLHRTGVHFEFPEG